jgi:hypothetical protein
LRENVEVRLPSVWIHLNQRNILDSLRSKIAVMRAHELEVLDDLPRHPLELVDEDLARLMSRAATAF